MSFFGINFGPADAKRSEESPSSQEMLPQNFSVMSHDSSVLEHGEHEMTKDEVNKLVHNALLRARKATTPNRDRQHQAASPLSSFDGGAGSSVAPNSPMRRPYQMPASLEGIITVDSNDTHKDMHALLSPTMDSAMDCERSVSTQRSILSTDSVLRKVEAEIANAKRAARATTRNINRTSNNPGEHDDEVSYSGDNDNLTDILNDHLADDEDLRNVLAVGDDAEMQHQFVATPVQARNLSSVPSSEDRLQIKYNPEPTVRDKDSKIQSEKDDVGEVDENNKGMTKKALEISAGQVDFHPNEHPKVDVGDLNCRKDDIHEALEVSIDDVVVNENLSVHDSNDCTPKLDTSISTDRGHGALEISVDESEIEIQHSPQREGNFNQNEAKNNTVEDISKTSTRILHESKTDNETVATSSNDGPVSKSDQVGFHQLEEKKVDSPLDESDSSTSIPKTRPKTIDKSQTETTSIRDANNAGKSNQEETLEVGDSGTKKIEEKKEITQHHTDTQVKQKGKEEIENDHDIEILSAKLSTQQVSNLGFSEDSIDNAANKENNPIMSLSSVNSSGNQKVLAQKIDLNSGKVQFRNPYPYPPPLPKPRSAEDIIKENKLGIPVHFSKWSKPSAALEKLFSASQGESLHRRSNACGALKVLSLKKKNQLALVRTKGFLDALAFAIAAQIPNNRGRDVALDSRARGVSTLLNVAGPKDNRLLIGVHPKVVASLLNVLEEDQGEARVQGCATLALLAKTKENREFMAEVPRLFDILAHVLLGSIDEKMLEEGFNNDEDQDSDQCTEDDENKDDQSDLDATDCENDGFSADGSNSFSSGADDDTENLENEDSHDEDSSVDGSSVSSAPSKLRSKQKSIRSQKDALHGQYLRQARVNACATLMHLSKHCAILEKLAGSEALIRALVQVSREFDNPIHTRCIEIVCNLTKLPSNQSILARDETLIDSLVMCGKSKFADDRLWSMRTFQNLATDSSSKVAMANGSILTLLSICSMRKDEDEQFAAVAALYNLSTEPGAVVSLTNTRNVVATLVHLAHNSDTKHEVRHLACDTLATVGLWLQTLAASGKVPPGAPKLLLPSHKTIGWKRWEA